MQLFLATDERDEVSTVQRLEATFGTTRTFDPPGPHWPAEALKSLCAEIGQLEQGAHQPGAWPG